MIKASFPQDGAFKQSMRNLPVAREMFELYLPKNILSVLNLNKLELTNSSYIDEKYNQTCSDILYKVELLDIDSNIIKTNQDGYLYILCEHQSTPDKWMPRRFLSYIDRIMEDHIEQGYKNLPLIVPILVYNGVRPYLYSNDIYDLFQNKKLAQEIMFKPFKLIDLTQMSDDELTKNNWSGFMQMVLKHFKDEDFFPALEKISDTGIIRFLLDNDAEQIIRDLIYCIVDNAKLKNDLKLVKILDKNSQKLGGEAMSLLQMKYNEGIKYGRSRGISQGISQGIIRGVEENKNFVIRKMLSNNFSLQSIADIVDMDIDDLKQKVQDDEIVKASDY